MTHIVRWAQKINSSTLAYLYCSLDSLFAFTEVAR